MSTEHPFSISEAQFKEVSARLKAALAHTIGADPSNSQALQILSAALFSKPYEEVKVTVLSRPAASEEKAENSSEGEYVRLGMSRCVYCNSSDIEGGDAEVDGGDAYVPVHCNNCNAQWNDVYKFQGIEDFVEG